MLIRHLLAFSEVSKQVRCFGPIEYHRTYDSLGDFRYPKNYKR